MPTRFSGKAATQAMYPALESAARELASDNIMCAVMLTGVLFLQVRFSHLYRFNITRANNRPGDTIQKQRRSRRGLRKRN